MLGCMKRLLGLLLLVTSVCAAEAPAFFAMDTAARGKPEESATLLSELGYAGFGGRPATAKAYAAELAKRKVTFTNAYHVTKFSHDATELPADLVQAISALEGLDTTLWLGIQQVQLPKGLKAGPEAGDAVVVPALKKALVLAKAKRVKVSLYPHAGFWAESVDACLRVANAVDDPDLGVTFNLCHWLKVEGSERDPVPVIKAALPRLNFITINGADGGDTRKLGWDKLIQPLGRGSYDVKAFVANARAAGYRDPFGFQGYAIKMDSKELLKETMEAWKGMVR
jgi:sugar phosphate isomerase/epimerase